MEKEKWQLNLYEASYTQIGYLGRPFKYSGVQRLIFHDGFTYELLESCRFIFLNIDGYKVPFEVENWTSEDPCKVKLQNIDTSETAKAFTQKSVFLLTNDVKNRIQTSTTHPLQYLVGYSLWNQKEFLGRIEKVIDYPEQTLAVVFIQEKEVFIPLHTDLISNENREQQKLTMSLPDGLIELYLE